MRKPKPSKGRTIEYDGEEFNTMMEAYLTQQEAKEPSEWSAEDGRLKCIN